MNRFTMALGSALALALATPALADKTDDLLINQYRDKIAQARATPGVQRNGSADLDKAEAMLPDLKKSLDDDRGSQSASIAKNIDTLIETARTRAATAREEAGLERDKAQSQARVSDAEAAAADAQAAAQAAQATAAAAQADNAALRRQMAAYQLKQTQLGATLVLQDVVFQTGKADLKPGAAERLRPLASYLQANPQVKVRIDGHTDSEGADAYNQTLSNNRAAAVRSALAGMGVAQDRIEAVGHGESQPVADNATPAGRQQNRRVEVTLVGQQANAFAG